MVYAVSDVHRRDAHGRGSDLAEMGVERLMATVGQRQARGRTGMQAAAKGNREARGSSWQHKK